MTLLFVDGFEGQDTAIKWSTTGVGQDFDYTGVAPRFGTGNCLNNPTGVGSTMQMNLGITASAKVIFGCALRFALVSAQTVLAFWADGGSVEHVRIALTAGGAFTIGRATTVLATSAAGVVTTGTWFYLEVSAVVSDTVGAVDVRVNGVSVVSVSGVDTKNAGTSTNIDLVAFTGRNSGNCQIDDVYVCNALGTVNNDFLGDIRVQTLKPNGAGNVTQLTPVGSGTNWQNVDESPVSTADYNYSSTAGQQDLYALEEVLGGTTAVLGVQVNSLARKTDTSSRSIKNLVRVGGTTTASAAIPLTSQTDTYSTVHNVNPTTSAAWAVGDITALEAGVEVV